MAMKASAAEETTPDKTIKSTSVAMGGEVQEGFAGQHVSMGDPDAYGSSYGILTFRGGPLRQNAAYGKVTISDEMLAAEQSGTALQPKLKLGRSARTLRLADGSTGFGVGSQPIIVKWPKVIREMMDIYPSFVNTAEGKSPMKEVIVPASDGQIYFYDLESQTPSRDTINIGMSLDVAASVSPYGYPLLYVGQTSESMTVIFSENSSELRDGSKSTKQTVKGITGMRVYSLLDHSLAGFETTLNLSAPYANTEVYSSPLVYVDPVTHQDTLLYTTASGMFYTLPLNTQFDLQGKSVSVSPADTTYSYKTKLKKDTKEGIRTSIAAYGDYAYFGDMSGLLQCVDMNTLQPVWARSLGESIVSTPALEVDDAGVWLYTGTVLNFTKKSAAIHMMKLNALTGEVVWDVTTELKGQYESKTAKAGLYAGVQASPVVGEGDIDDMVIFNVNRLQIEKKVNSAVLYGLDKTTGSVLWQQILDAESVSSPIAMYRKDNGQSYIVLGDDNGTLRVMDGYNGTTLHTLNLGGPIQSSPAAYENHIVVGNTTGQIFFVDLDFEAAR